jgi:hypothetical protein
MVSPDETESAVRSPEATAEDVVEGIQVVTPRVTGDQNPRNLVVEAFEGREACSVDFKHGLGHHLSS